MWHVDRLIVTKDDHEDDSSDTSEVDPIKTSDLDEWEMLSQMGVHGGENLNALEMLGRCDFDNINNWGECSIPSHLYKIVEHFIRTKKTSRRDEQSML